VRSEPGREPLSIAPLRGRIQDSLEASGCRENLQRVLGKITSSSDLIRFVHRYTVFNGDFAGGVANLAGAFHVQQELFREPSEPLSPCADRSAEIASYVFFAAEDEYAVRGGGPRWTHRRLGQRLLKHTLEYFDVSPEQFRREFRLTTESLEALRAVKTGYRVNAAHTEAELFDSLGFHIGAELLAHVEFNAIHGHLCAHSPDYVEHLRRIEIGHGLNAYHWVDLHTSVEGEHFDAAIVAAEKVLEYYAGDRGRDWVARTIVEGFGAFASLQIRFFGAVLEP
jgi:hypothetical protein